MSRQSRFDARYWMLGAGALGRPRGRVCGGRREEGSGWGTQVYLWRIHFDIWQNQYNIVKFKNKIKFKKKKKKKWWREARMGTAIYLQGTRWYPLGWDADIKGSSALFHLQGQVQFPVSNFWIWVSFQASYHMIERELEFHGSGPCDKAATIYSDDFPVFP